MTLLEKRALKIVQLQEELEEAKRIISQFVWPPDGDTKSNQKFQINAAKFAGCTIPVFCEEEEHESIDFFDHSNDPIKKFLHVDDSAKIHKKT